MRILRGGLSGERRGRFGNRFRRGSGLRICQSCRVFNIFHFAHCRRGCDRRRLCETGVTHQGKATGHYEEAF
jgi:hypothetical protein